ncbi:MAG: HEAT repeat domain-containing protein, partial [Tepidisphaerales bacterium]
MKSKLLAALALAIASIAAAPAADMAEIMTVKTIADDQQSATYLFALGPAKIADICGQVIPLGSGDDTTARMQIASMVRLATAPGQEKNREALAKALVAAIEKNSDPEVKSFFVYQLRFVGKDESVDTLAKLLGEEKNQLCPTAAMSLTAINTPKAADAVAAALASAPNANLVTLLTAAGTLRAKAAEAAIVSRLDDADKAVRHAARYAAAQMGLPQVAAPLSKAAADGALGQYERSQMVTLLFVYAQRRAELGSGTEAAEICRTLLKAEPQDPNVRCGALSTLLGIEKEKALPEVLAAFDSPDSEYRNAALLLAEKLINADHTAQYVGKLTKAEPEARADIVAMLGRRGDPAALPAVIAAMGDKADTVRATAYIALPRLAGEQTVSQLLK